MAKTPKAPALYQIIVRKPNETDPGNSLKLSFIDRETMEDTIWGIQFAQPGHPLHGLEVVEDMCGAKIFTSRPEAIETLLFWFE